MFRYMVKFLKVLVIVCLIGVSLRIIEVIFIKEKAKDLAVSNTTNEIQYEETLQIANNEEKIVEEKVENTTNQQAEKNTVAATKKEAVVEQSKKEESAKVEKQETIKTSNEDKQEEQQQVTTKQTIPETTKQDVVETKKETKTQVETKAEEKYTEIAVNVTEKKECNGNKHGMEVGNSGKWFNTKDEAIATYKAEIKKWGDKWTDKDNPISDEEYYKNCPIGYEVWSCMYCGKWTLNYYYDN